MNQENFSEMEMLSLQNKVAETKKELFQLRLEASTAQVQNCSLFKKLRRRVARMLTEIRKRNNEKPKG